MLTPVQEINIQTFLHAIPIQIRENVESCMEKWTRDETTDGYPHPAAVCANYQMINMRQPFLTVQQSIDLHCLKNHLQAIK